MVQGSIEVICYLLCCIFLYSNEHAHYTSSMMMMQGCLGALNDTYINVQVPLADAPRYRNRKGHITINTLAVCNRHLRFVYVLSGWERSIGDLRILRDAISRPLGLKVPKSKTYIIVPSLQFVELFLYFLGCYYLCDNGY